MKKIKSREKKKRIFKIVRVVIGFCFLIFGINHATYVKAGMNDSRLERNRTEGVYAIATVGGQQHLYYLDMYEMNGITSYCIDLGKSITTDIYHSTGNFSVSYLTGGQIEYIRSVSYFGYRYEGHDDYRYYMAAQEIIWEYLTNGSANVEWTNVLDVNGPRINIDSYKNEIFRLMFRYSQRVTFDWIDGCVLNLGDEIILEDIAQLLSDYEIVSSGHTNAVIEGNYLKFKVSDQYVGRESIVLKKKEYYSYDSLLYYYDVSQRLISNGNFNPRRKEIYFNVKGAKLNGQLVDKMTGESIPLGQASLRGAVYELYNQNGELLGSYETDETGRFEVDNLPYGHYSLKQIVASEGYLLNGDIVEFDISENEMEIKLEEQVISNVIEVLKVYGEEGGKYSSEEGVQFSVYDIHNQVYDTMVTGVDGFATVWLPYGTYMIHQDNTSFGYSKVDDFEVIVQEYLEEKIHYSLINTLIECMVEISTRDYESGVMIPSEKFSYRVKKEGDNDYLEFEGKSVFTTNSDGTLVFPMIFNYGDYILEQVDSSDGYALNDDIIEFSLNDKTNFSLFGEHLITSIDVYNQKILGKVNILANKEKFVSSDHDYHFENIIRVGSPFCLVADEDIIVDGIVTYRKGEMVSQVETDNDGRVSIDGLSLGKYCVIDEEGEQQECFHLESTTNREKVVEKSLEFTIFMKKGTITITNHSESGDYIEGSIFEVYDKDEQVIYEGITNENGVIKVPDLSLGDYCIHQKSVPIGYMIQEEDVCFSLEGDKEITFLNEENSKKWITVPNTLQNSENYLKVLILFLLGIGVICYKKIFISKS